jgi:hypothetical protein
LNTPIPVEEGSGSPSHPSAGPSGIRETTWGWIAWLLPAAAVLLSYLAINDLAYLIRAGDLMRRSGELLRNDVFTFTMDGRPWLNQQWGAELLLSGLYSLVGWRGLFVLRALLVSVGVGVTYRATLRSNEDAFISGSLTLGAFVVVLTLPGTFALRPQLLAMPLFLVARWIIDGRVAHSRRLVWLPLVGIVWSNIHGSFVLLPLLLVVAFAQDLATKSSTRIWTGSLALVTSLTPLATPWGSATYAYLVDLSTAPVVAHVIDEWKPLIHQWPAGAAFLVWNVIVVAVCVRRKPAWPTVEQAATFLIFSVLAIWSGRNLLWWMLAVPPVVGAYLRDRRPSGDARPASFRVIIAALVILLAIGLVRTATASPSERLLSEAPLGAADALRAFPTGTRVFDGRWGSWFEFADPALPMFVDSRAELFSDAIWSDYFQVSGASPGWQDILRRWDVGVVVGAKDHDPGLIDALRIDPHWYVVYEDATSAVFARSVAVRTGATA